MVFGEVIRVKSGHEAVAPMIEAVRTIARVTYQGVFVADLNRNNFLGSSS